MEEEQRRELQYANKDIEFGYSQPIPTLSPYVPISYYQMQGYKTPLLNDTNQSMMDQYYQNSVINTSIDHYLAKSNMQGLSQEQYDELKKSILEKKEQADNEVNKSEGFFAKINYMIQWLTGAKSAILVIYALYKLYMYNDSSDLYTTFCALIMALGMLKKSKVAEQAIEKKDHKASKGLLQKALVFAIIFIVIYIAWSYSLLNNSGFRGSKQQLTQIELESNFLKTQQFENSSFAKNSKYIRVGAPANNFKRNNELNFDPNYRLFKADFKTLENEKLIRKTMHDKEIAQKYSALYQLPLELPLLILISLVTLYLGIKLSIYFISFNNYNKALEKQENLNGMIVYLDKIKPIEKPKIKIEEEKEIPKEVTENVFIEPKIEEEQTELPYSFDLAINDYKIHEDEMSYPVLSEFTYKA